MEQVAVECETMNRVHIRVVLDVLAKLRKVILLASSRLFVRPHGTNRFPLDGLPLNLISKYFLQNLSPKTLSVIKIGQK